MDKLCKNLIRLAHQQPKLRKHLVPLLRREAAIRDEGASGYVETYEEKYREKYREPKGGDPRNPPTEIDSFGTMMWTDGNGKPHRDGDRPAVVYRNGTMMWFRNGKPYRDRDKPARVYPTGEMQWTDGNGNLHRDGDRPAVVYRNGTMEWWSRGKKHRDDHKPARVYPDGTMLWFRNGKGYTPKPVWQRG